MALSHQTVNRRGSQVHDQKRYGQHRKHTKPFLKAYYPYLPLFGIAALAIIFMGAKVLGEAGAIMGSITVGIGAAALLA
jgi:hypothetical protein